MQRTSAPLCLSILVLISASLSVEATEAAETNEAIYAYEKGQALDILFLASKPDTQDQLKDYFQAVFPIAQAAGYQPLPGFKLSQAPTQGNYHPSQLVLATWKDRASRAKAMVDIEAAVPDFHQRRREIWSSFAMTVYEIKEDTSFTAYSDRLYVLTAYWAKESGSFRSFKRAWRKKAQAKGGAVQLELEDGFSPFGYRHDPDYLTITEWESREAFDSFYADNLAMDHSAVEHVNQFILDLPKPSRR